MNLLQSGLKCVRLTGNITARNIANAIGCLRDNTSLKELTISTVTDQSEVHFTAYHYYITFPY